MKTMIKKQIQACIRYFVYLLGLTRAGRYFETLIVKAAMERCVEVVQADMSFKFAAVNALCAWRYATLSTKEPETLEWIDSMPSDAVLWDIGANIGLYSVYAAKKRNCKVWAFEPSVFNLEVFARNVHLNKLTSNICIVPIALSNKLGASQMRMTAMEWGGALSTFGESYGWDGERLEQVFEYRTLGLRMDDVVRVFGIPHPAYIKMDVDGIEHLILSGGADILSKTQGVLIEVNEAFQEQASMCQKLLTQAGLVLKEKRQSEMISTSMSGFQTAFNQIWMRPSAVE
jgi:FkbM family methyltransferase